MARSLLLAFALATPLAQAHGQDGRLDAFNRRFDAYVRESSILGASYALVRDGRIFARHDVGFADIKANQHVDSNTIFHYGSITKTLVAITIIQLRDRGLLSLDDPATKFIPELRRVYDPFGSPDSITLRMLLTHSAGFQNPTWPWTRGESWEPFEPTTWEQLVAMLPYQKLQFKPGTRWSYSNPGFIYLARVVEQISGDPWEDYVQKNIFAPLELRWSYFRSTPYYLSSHRSHNYYIQRDSAGRERVVDNGADFDPGITSPNGAWNAPVSDLVKYTAFLTNAVIDGMSRDRFDVVLPRATLEEMWKPGKPMSQSYESSPNQWIGLSFFLLDRGGTKIVGHTGSQAGFRSFFYFNPATSTAVIAAFNSTNSTMAEAPYNALRNLVYDFLASQP